MKVLVASRNPKKLAELQRVLDARDVHGIELVSLAEVGEYPETPESGRTFGDNALIKARDGARHAGLPCIADDSGLVVDELNGMPGVLSARWCGEHGRDDDNTALVLAQLSDTPDARRGGGFVSVCALVLPESLLERARAAGLSAEALTSMNDLVETTDPVDEGEFVVKGEWRGRILRSPRGTHGFGYDPIFVPEEEDARVRAAGGESVAQARSSAELSPEEKDALSHRGRALAQLVPVLRVLGRM